MHSNLELDLALAIQLQEKFEEEIRQQERASQSALQKKTSGMCILTIFLATQESRVCLLLNEAPIS